MSARRSGAVGVEPEHRQRRRRLAEQLRHALGAGAVTGERDRAAVGAGLRQRLGVTAVVTAKAARGLVDDERDVAVGAPPRPAAGSAAQRTATNRGGSASRSPSRGLADLAERLRPSAHAADRSPPRRSACRPPPPRAAPPVGALGQLQPGQAVPALRPRRRAAADEDGAGRLRARRGHLPRVVARIALLLVGRRRAPRRPRSAPDREPARTPPTAGPTQTLASPRAQTVPLVAALAGREPGVKESDAVTEARREPSDGLRRRGRSREPARSRRARGPARPRRRSTAWYWGHEHQCVIYDEHERWGARALPRQRRDPRAASGRGDGGGRATPSTPVSATWSGGA